MISQSGEPWRLLAWNLSMGMVVGPEFAYRKLIQGEGTNRIWRPEGPRLRQGPSADLCALLPPVLALDALFVISYATRQIGTVDFVRYILYVQNCCGSTLPACPRDQGLR